MGPARVLGQSLPTVWILYFLCWTSLGDTRGYRETFSGGSVRLDLSLEVNPEGWLQPSGGRVHFGGTLTRGADQDRFVGFRVRRDGKRYYVFSLEDGSRFVGAWKEASVCPPILNYTVTTADGHLQQGTLRGGFCY